MQNSKYKKPPRAAVWILRKLSVYRNNYSSIEDFEEEYMENLKNDGRLKAAVFCWIHVINMIRFYMIFNMKWSCVMFKNYLKIAARILKRQKGYSFINIFGLTLGLTCSVFILIYVRFELSYDNYHEDAGSIYRIALHQKTSSGIQSYSGVHPNIASTVKKNIPQVCSAARIIKDNYGIKVKYGNKKYTEYGLTSADPEIFDIFSMEFIKGDASDALRRPNTAVITQSMAVKYFNDENPVGKTLEILLEFTEFFEITAVIKDPPANSHYKFGLIRTLKLDPHEEEWNTKTNFAHTYIKLLPDTKIDNIEKQIIGFVQSNLNNQLEEFGYKFTYFLQPLRDIHLYSNLRGEAEPPGNALYIYIFSIAGILVLLIACINFMNLSTARSAKRLIEIGIRKIAGAGQKQLIQQFIFESVLISFSSFLLSIFIVSLFLPQFNIITNKNFSFSYILKPDLLLYFLGITIITGLISGSYPAFFISAFKPSSVLKSNVRINFGSYVTSKILVTGQFIISAILIVGTLVIYRQITYMKNRPLGFDKKQKIVIELPHYEMITNTYENVKNEFTKHIKVLSASASSSIPGREFIFWRFWPSGQTEKSQPVHFLSVDFEFMKEYHIELLAGRGIDHGMNARGYLLNEAAVNAFDLKSPEEAVGVLMGNEDIPVIGVIKNFHFKGLQSPVEPLCIVCEPFLFKYISLRVNTEDIQETLSFIEKKYNDIFPNETFDFFFLDADIKNQYVYEEQVGKIFSIFTFIGLVIACQGLFGLASFTTEQRKKEIGIRKVLGSSVSAVVFMLSKEFVKNVLIANVLALPAAWYISNIWLRNFAYRTSINAGILILSFSVSLAIAMFTVSYHAIKSARANPVNSLKYE